MATAGDERDTVSEDEVLHDFSMPADSDVRSPEGEQDADDDDDDAEERPA